MRTQGKKLCCVRNDPRGAFPVYLTRLASGGETSRCVYPRGCVSCNPFPLVLISSPKVKLGVVVYIYCNPNLRAATRPRPVWRRHRVAQGRSKPFSLCPCVSYHVSYQCVFLGPSLNLGPCRCRPCGPGIDLVSRDILCCDGSVPRRIYKAELQGGLGQLCEE